MSTKAAYVPVNKVPAPSKSLEASAQVQTDLNSKRSQVSEVHSRSGGSDGNHEKITLENAVLHGNPIRQYKPVVDTNTPEIKPASIKDMMRYATRFDLLLLVCGVALNIVGGAMTPASSVIFNDLTNALTKAQSDYDNDQFVFEEFRDHMMRPIILYFILGVVIFVVVYSGMACLYALSERMVDVLRKKFLFRVLHQDMQWFDKNELGKLTQKMSANADRIRDGTSDKLGIVIQAMSCAISGICMGFYLSWQMTCIMLVMMPIVFGSLIIAGFVIKSALKRELEAYASASAVAEEVINGIRTVASMNGQLFEMERYGKELREGCDNGRKKQRITAIASGIVIFLLFGFMGLAFWAGTRLVIEGYLPNGGIVFGCFWAVMVGIIRIGQALPQVGTIVQAKLATGELLALIDQEPEQDSCSDEGQTIKKVQGKIEFTNVHFRYPSRPDKKILFGVSYSIEAGQTIALVGHSGCGKSTMIGLLMRYYTQEEGTVTIDGVHVKDFNIQWLRNVIGLVSQEPVMFATTIEMNLRLGKMDATFEEMVEACQMANAHEFILDLPDGYKTVVGEGGVKLSGGQKQRLSIARILIRNPKILLLDEATSALDTESERHVQKAIEKASQGRTTIMIAHRLSTVRHADKIFVFDHGKIAEAGNHLELMVRGGIYKTLVMAQEIDSNHGNAVVPMVQSVSEKSEARDVVQSVRFVPPMGAIAPAMEVDHEDPVEKDIAPPASMMQILKFADKERRMIIIGLLCTAVRGCVWPAFALIYGHLFETLAKALEENDETVEEMNRTMAISYGALGVIAGIFSLASGICLGFSGENLTMRMRLAVFKNFLCQDASFFDNNKHSTGKLTARLSIDAPNVQAAIDIRLADCLQGIISLLVGVAIAFYFGWEMALCGLVSAFVVVILQFGLAIYLKKRAAEDLKAAEDANREASESIEFVKTVQALTRQKFMYEKFLELNVVPFRRAILRGLLQAASYGLIAAFLNINFGLAYGLSLALIKYDITTPFKAFQVVEAMTSGFIAIMAAASYFPEYVRARVSAGVMFKMMNAPSKINNMSEEGTKPKIKGNITFKNCFFAYPNGKKKMILKDFSVKVDKGQTLAFVGPSGCGKSTTILLLERFYNLMDGVCLIDDHDVTQININYLRKNIALVGQEPTLFNLTIRENITYGLTEVPDEKIKEAAKLANAHNFIMEFPEGYETCVGPRGSRLSGGQKQRIAIARAMVRDPKVLLLDEATSALDTESEKLVQEALEKAGVGRTCITIAHRLSTIQHAHKIAVCRAGKVIEEGDHKQLIAKHGLYYKLAKKQRG